MKLDSMYNIYVPQENQGAASIGGVKRSHLDINEQYYGITVKCNLGNDQTVYFSEDFKPIFEQRLKRFRFIKLAWELDKKNRLHCHILADGSVNIKYKLIHLYGWTIDIRPLASQEDKLRWESYIGKGDSLEALLLNQSRNCGYMFGAELILSKQSRKKYCTLDVCGDESYPSTICYCRKDKFGRMLKDLDF